MFSFDAGKYKGIIVSVALFLLLDASVLLMNFYISFEIADDAEGVNIAGRQRMLSQRTMKSLFDIAASTEDSSELERAIKELNATTTLFNNTLIAFNNGGKTKSASGEPTTLAKVSSEQSKRAVTAAVKIWKPYWEKLENLRSKSPTDTPFEFEEALGDTIRYGKEFNLTLLKLMNDLTVDLENVASSKATRLRMIQTIGITLAVINFFIIMFHFLRQLRESDEKIAAAQKETQEILETVNEGLFLLDENLVLGEQHSDAILEIFGRSDFAGITFDELLGDIISSKDMGTAKNFVGLLFKPEVKQNLIGDLNPLNEVEVHISTEAGGFTNKFLSFTFSRVVSEGEESDIISHVLVTVTDITQQVKLSRELEQMQAQNEQQFEVLTKIIHTSSDLLNSYLDNSFETFNGINKELKIPAKSQSQFIAKAHNIFAYIHNFKGESAALELDQFVDLAHKFEDQLDKIKENPSLSGNDFLPLTVSLNQMISQAEATKKLSDKLFQFTGANNTDITQTSDRRNWTHLDSLARSVAERQNKHIELITSGLNDFDLSEELYQAINTISLQLIRNAITHGIEDKDAREESQKNDIGKINIRLSKRKDGTLELVVHDDGSGIDVDTIRNVAIEKGIISEFQAESMDSKQLIALVFEPAFSTREESDLDSGRGMGMHLVKKQVKNWAGKILIKSRHGRGTSFRISLLPQAEPIKEVA